MGELDRLQLFMYLLTRDHLPFGEVCGILSEIDKLKNDMVLFTDSDFAKMAMKMAKRLLRRE